MEKEFGLKAIAINSSQTGSLDDNLEVGSDSPNLPRNDISDIVWQAIVRGEYQIVFLSPEMMQSRRFISKVLQRPGFAQRVLCLAVDEAHCVSRWGDSFRKQYGTLGNIRAFLPRSTPVIAVSATLSPRVRKDVLSRLHFSDDYVAIDVGNDRPNVSLVVRTMKHALNTFKDTAFVVPKNYTEPSKILKTLVYVDNIEMGGEIIDYLNSLLQEKDQQSGIIRPFNAVHTHEFREEVMRDFRSGKVRILVCTDAAGMVRLL